ncbi:MAG: hypothetical protein ABSD12_06285 [Paraburkholderia sp.]
MTTSYTLATFRHEGKPTPVIEVGRRYWPISTVAPDLLPRGIRSRPDAALRRLGAV